MENVYFARGSAFCGNWFTNTPVTYCGGHDKINWEEKEKREKKNIVERGDGAVHCGEVVFCFEKIIRLSARLDVSTPYFHILLCTRRVYARVRVSFSVPVLVVLYAYASVRFVSWKLERYKCYFVVRHQTSSVLFRADVHIWRVLRSLVLASLECKPRLTDIWYSFQ